MWLDSPILFCLHLCTLASLTLYSSWSLSTWKGMKFQEEFHLNYTKIGQQVDNLHCIHMMKSFNILTHIVQQDHIFYHLFELPANFHIAQSKQRPSNHHNFTDLLWELLDPMLSSRNYWAKDKESFVIYEGWGQCPKY